MKLCFNTSAYSKFELEHAVKQIGEIGYQGIEMMVDRPHAFPDDFDEKRMSELKLLVKQYNMTPVGLMSANVWAWGSNMIFEPSFINYKKEIREKRKALTKQVIDFAATLECFSVQTGAGICNFADFPKPRQAWTYLVEGLEECAEYAKNKGVVLSIEAEPGTLVENTVDMARIVKDVSSSAFGLTLDIGHVAVMGDDIMQTIGLLHDRTVNVHIEDILGRSHFHLIPGEGKGTLNLVPIVKELQNLGYDHFLTCDLYTQIRNPDYAAERSYQYLSKLL